jgi:hypothetical protein
LNCLPKSIGFYVDARTGKLTPSGKNAKILPKTSDNEIFELDELQQ